MVEKGIRGEIFHAIHRYAKENNKYMKYYDENKESLFLEYLDANKQFIWLGNVSLLMVLIGLKMCLK